MGELEGEVTGLPDLECLGEILGELLPLLHLPLAGL